MKIEILKIIKIFNCKILIKIKRHINPFISSRSQGLL